MGCKGKKCHGARGALTQLYILYEQQLIMFQFLCYHDMVVSQDHQDTGKAALPMDVDSNGMALFPPALCGSYTPAASDDWMDAVLAEDNATSTTANAASGPQKEFDNYLDGKLVPRAA